MFGCLTPICTSGLILGAVADEQLLLQPAQALASELLVGYAADLMA